MPSAVRVGILHGSRLDVGGLVICVWQLCVGIASPRLHDLLQRYIRSAARPAVLSFLSGKEVHAQTANPTLGYTCAREATT